MTLEKLYYEFMDNLQNEMFDIEHVNNICYEFLINLESIVSPISMDTDDIIDIIRSFNDVYIRKSLSSKCKKFMDLLNITDNDLLSPEILNVAIALQLYYADEEI